MKRINISAVYRHDFCIRRQHVFSFLYCTAITPLPLCIALRDLHPSTSGVFSLAVSQSVAESPEIAVCLVACRRNWGSILAARSYPRRVFTPDLEILLDMYCIICDVTFAWFFCFCSSDFNSVSPRPTVHAHSDFIQKVDYLFRRRNFGGISGWLCVRERRRKRTREWEIVSVCIYVCVEQTRHTIARTA